MRNLDHLWIYSLISVTYETTRGKAINVFELTGLSDLNVRLRCNNTYSKKTAKLVQ